MPQRSSRILLVDDDELSLELVAMLLEAENYAVLRADSGAKAVEELEQLRATAPQDLPEILLLDQQMPGLSGAELAKHCRQRSPEKTLILAMSATRPPDSLLTGYDGFVSKPFSVEAFHQALERGIEEPDVRASTLDSSLRSDLNDSILDDSIYGKLAAMMPPARLNEIYSTCLADTVRRIPVMEKAGVAGNLQEVRRIAHGIKGGASMIGARRIAAITGELESGNYSRDDVPRLLRDLSIACEQLGSILLLPLTKQVKGKE